MRKYICGATFTCLLIGCGLDSPEIEEKTTVTVESNEGSPAVDESETQDVIVDKSGDGIVIPTEVSSNETSRDFVCEDDGCKPVQFSLTIVKNGEIVNADGDVIAEGETLIAKEGIVTDWRVNIGFDREIDSRKVQLSLPELSVKGGIELKEKLARGVWFEVKGLSEDAGYIPITVDDITYCVENGFGDETYCRQSASAEETNRQNLSISYLIAKSEAFSKFQTKTCEISSLASLLSQFDTSGTISSITELTNKLLNCPGTSEDSSSNPDGEQKPDNQGSLGDAEDSSRVFSDVADGSPVPSDRVEILSTIPGFGRGTIGGANGSIRVINSLAGSGPGSLKEALESNDPLWIIFKPGMSGTIIFDETVKVSSFKTLDGRGSDVILKINDKNYWKGGFQIGSSSGTEVENVVILNMTFDGSWEKYGEDSEGSDGINIRNGPKHIWIHQNTFTNWVDGAIDIKKDEGYNHPANITISSNYFTRIYQPMAVSATNLSVVRNYCTNVGKRCIQLNNYGRAHFANNVVEDWSSGEILASKDASLLFVDNNIYAPNSSFNRAGAALKKDTDIRGKWQGSNNHARGRSVNFTNESTLTSSFKTKLRDSYTPFVCSRLDTGCWDDFYDTITSRAGDQY